MLQVLSDTLGTLAYAVGLGPQVDTLLDVKFECWPEHYVSPVLDFGAGTCFFAKHLQDRGYQVTAVDIVNKNRFPDIALQIFDPPHLPFPSGSFETTLAHFVFHHIEQQDTTFSDLLRVTRGKVVISEDVIDSVGDEVLAALHTSTSPWSRSWSGFRSTQGWLKFFARFPVEIVAQRTIARWRTPFYPIRRVIFVLKVRETEIA